MKKLTLRLPDDEQAILEEKAKACGLSINEYIRQLIGDGATLQSIQDSISELREEIKRKE